MKRWNKRANTLKGHLKRAETNSRSLFFFNSNFQTYLDDLLLHFVRLFVLKVQQGQKSNGFLGKELLGKSILERIEPLPPATTRQNCINSNFHFQSVFGRYCFCEQMTFGEMKSWVLFQFASRFEIFQPNSRQPL